MNHCGVDGLVGESIFRLGAPRRVYQQYRPEADIAPSMPFQVILQGRTKLDLAGIGWWRPALGLAIYAVLLAVHEWIIGVPILPH